MARPFLRARFLAACSKMDQQQNGQRKKGPQQNGPRQSSRAKRRAF